jgi:signal transduction histidine kinase
VHTIIKEHNGEILVQSQLGEGTTFIILIPEYKL